MGRIALALALVLQLSGAAAGCTDDLGCHLNGKCQAGACACKPWWKGENCTLLNFVSHHMFFSLLALSAAG